MKKENKNDENDYGIDNLKANRYYKAVFEASEYYKKSKSIVKDYKAFVQSIGGISDDENIKKAHTIEKNEKEKKIV